MSLTSWQDYWQSDDLWTDSPLWDAGGEALFRFLRKEAGLRAEDDVMTFGCGGGHLECRLAPHVRSLTACDISGRAIERTLARTAASHVRGMRLPADRPAELPHDDHCYSLFIAASTVQYFPSHAAVARLLENFRKRALPGARALLADLPGPSDFLENSRLITAALTRGFSGPLVRASAALLTRGKVYRQASRTLPVLRFNRTQLEELLATSGLSGKIVRGAALHPGRLGLLVTFP